MWGARPLGMLAEDEDGDPDQPAPRIRSREDYYAAVELRRLRDGPPRLKKRQGDFGQRF